MTRRQDEDGFAKRVFDEELETVLPPKIRAILLRLIGRIQRFEPNFQISDLKGDEGEIIRWLQENGKAYFPEMAQLWAYMEWVRPRTLDELVALAGLLAPERQTLLKRFFLSGGNCQAEFPQILAPIIQPSRGCLIFQEQIQEVWEQVMGETNRCGDGRLIEIMDSQEKRERLLHIFVSKACSLGMSEEFSRSIFEDVCKEFPNADSRKKVFLSLRPAILLSSLNVRRVKKSD